MRLKYKYEKEDREQWYHLDDPDLEPFSIPLPEAPKKRTKIVGHFKAPKDQKWEVDPLPYSLVKLVKRCRTVERCWKEMERDPSIWKDEIKYIETQWYRRENGYWLYINGKPTYLTGKHYTYINFWEMDTETESPYPGYRDRDRRWWLIVDYCIEDPYIYGFNYPKHRREGATSRVSCLIWELLSKPPKGKLGGIQSMTEEKAEMVFQVHIIKGWKAMPFFFQPTYSGKMPPRKEMRFETPAKNVSGEGVFVGGDDALDNIIDFRSAVKGSYDGDKMIIWYGDEAGKTKDEDVQDRWRVVKKSLSVGAGTKIVGLGVHTSTVGEMDKGGGINFKNICKKSHFEKRNKNGQTASGLINLFFPAFDGLEGFIGAYGESIIDDPTPEQAAFIGRDVGAREYLMNTLEGMIEEGEDDDAAEEMRQTPKTFRECFKRSIKDCNFNKIILQSRLDDFVFKNPYKVAGNFKWVDGIEDSRVYWEPDPEGKFLVSYLFRDDSESNRWVAKKGSKYPLNTTRFSAGGDPFKFKKTLNKRKSDGGGAVLRMFDPGVDNPMGDSDEWETDLFCCTYSNRPKSKAIYGEDILMMCIYYGCTMNPEINVPYLWEYFDDRGYGGFLYYSEDLKSGERKATPGETTNEKVKEAIFREFHAHIERNGHREVHDELLDQCLEIENDMTDYDLFTAAGYALLGARTPIKHEEKPLPRKLNTIFRKYKIV